MMDKDAFLKATGNDLDGTTPDHIRALNDGTYVMVKRLLFHWTLIRGQQDDHDGYDDRWCYETEAGAMAALRAFPPDPGDHEPDGWHKHPATGRLRPGGEKCYEHVSR